MQTCKLTCDLSQQELKPGDLVAKLTVPIPRSLRKELVAYVEREVLPQYKGAATPFGSLQFSAEQMVAHALELEVAPAILFGLLPQLQDIVRDRCRRTIAIGVEARRRAMHATDELDELTVDNDH